MDYSPLEANIAGYTSAVLISYIGNAAVTFNGQIFRGRQFMKFISVSLAGLLVGQGATYLGIHTLELPYTFTLIVVTTLVAIFSFFFSRLWTFDTARNMDKYKLRWPSFEFFKTCLLRFSKSDAVILLIFLISIIPVVVAPILPMIDFYSHVARFFVLSQLHSDSFLQQYYDSNWSILPNIGMDVIGTSLMGFFPATIVDKTLVIIIFATQYFGIIAFGRQISGSNSLLTAVLSVPLLYSFILGWGFANFLFGLGLVFWGAAWWLSRREHLKVAVPVASLFALLIFLSHGLSFALYGLLLGGLELGRFIVAKPRSIRALSISTSALAIQAVAPAALFFASPTSKSLTGLTNADEAIRSLSLSGDIWPRIFDIFKYRISTIYRVSESSDAKIDLAVFAITIAILATLILARQIKIPRFMFPSLFIAFLLVIFTPPSIFGVGYVSDRMPLFFAFIFVGSISIGPQYSLAGKSGIYFLATVFAIKLSWIGASWQSYKQDMIDFRAVSNQIPPQRLVGFFNTANKYRLETERRCQMYGPLLVIYRSAAAPLFAYSSQQPISLRGRLKEAARSQTEWRGSIQRQQPIQERSESFFKGAGFDYILACRPLGVDQEIVTMDPVVQRGRFALFRIQR